MGTAMSLHEDLDRFIAQGQAMGWAEATVLNYRHLLGGLIGHLLRRGCRRFADVTPDDLDAYCADQARQEVAQSTRMRSAGLLRRFFVWLQDRGRIITNPAKGLPVPFDGEEDLPDPPLSEADVAALLDGLPRTTVCELRDACLLELLYGCGLRISEVVALDCDDLDLGRRTVLIRESKHDQTRLVPLPKTAAAAVKTYRTLRRTLLSGPDTGALFLAQRGSRLTPSSVYHLFEHLNAERGPNARHLHPHLFRHSVAVHLLRGGADVRYIQQFLGHASLDTTKIYLRLVPGQLREDYDAAMPWMGWDGEPDPCRPGPKDP